MPLFALGINHNSAPVDVRERMVFDEETLPLALRELKRDVSVSEAVIISTCNRTEIYTHFDGDPARLIDWLCKARGVERDWLAPHLYLHQEADAIHHLMRVAAGLDSMILGEPQILGQAKAAYTRALDNASLGAVLGRAFQCAFGVAKQVRTETAIGANPVSVAFAAVSLAKQIFGELTGQNALLVGAGESVELTARYLRDQGIRHMTVANRTLERARQVAAPYQAEAITLSEIPAQLPYCDILIAATASPLPLIGKGSVERALKSRKHKPIFMVDLAVPRDIEAEVGDLKDVFLYTVDDLHEVIQDNLRSRQDAAAQAEEIIALQVEQFMTWRRSLQAVDTIRQLRERADEHRQEVLTRALARLQAGEPAEQALQFLAHTLTNKLIHTPTEGLRKAAGRGDPASLRAVKQLLDLADDETSQ